MAGHSPSMAPTEEQRRARFERVYRENSQAVLGYALRRSARPEDAADVLSEVMLTAWRRLDAVPAGGEARFWLLGVARNVLANQSRSAGRRLRLGQKLRTDLADAFAGDLGGALETSLVVRQALAELSPDDREILLLTTWEGLDPSEAAAVLAIKPAAARTRLHRARARLRRALEPHLEGPARAGMRSEEGR